MGEDGEGGEKKEKPAPQEEYMDPALEEFEKLIRFGERTEYSPSLTMESLADFMPSFPSTSGGMAAAVKENLSVLGSAEPVGATLGLNDRSHASRMRHQGLRYFAELKTKESVEEYMQQRQVEYDAVKATRAAAKAAEGSEGSEAAPAETLAVETPAVERPRIIGGPEESIRKVIVDRALAGVHETPQFAADPVGVARSWHLRDGSYTQKDVDSFEKMLQSMMSSGGKSAIKLRAGQRQG